MHKIDLNSDLGEYKNDVEEKRESAILSIVSRCNIACGGHAGNEASMHRTLNLAREMGVACGVHPSYPDIEGFGRRSMTMDSDQLKVSLKNQINLLYKIACELDIPLEHVKPHGALYNDAMDNALLSRLIVEVVAEVDDGLAIVGIPDSELEKAAAAMDMHFIREGYCDRRYNSKGRLIPRSEKGAVIDDMNTHIEQSLALAMGKPVWTSEGTELNLNIQTLCIHSDTEKSLKTAQAIHRAFIEAGIHIGRKN